MTECRIDALNKSLKLNKSLEFTKYYQLASVIKNDNDILPSNRTMEFRQFYKQDYIISCIDLRTDIINSINSYGAINWYFPLTKEQYRINCDMYVYNGNDLFKLSNNIDNNSNVNQEEIDDLRSIRLNIWKNKLNVQGRELFDRQSPGKLMESVPKLSDLDIYDPQAADKNNPSPHFGLLLLKMTRIDYTRLAKTIDLSKPQHYESILQPTRKSLRVRHVLKKIINGMYIVYILK